MVYHRLKKLQFWVFPPRCVLCGDPGHACPDRPALDLCAGCREDLPRNRSACRRCGIALSSDRGLICGRCQNTPPSFDSLLAPWRYDPPLDWLVRQMKYHGRLDIAGLLGELLARELAGADIPLPDCIVPVPLHDKRLAERGYDQALELARPVARRLAIPIASRSLIRRRHTRPQAGLDAHARRGNLRGAFALTGPLPGRRVAVLDDVVTTGSTVEEVSLVLRQAGVRELRVWALARAGHAL